MNMSSWRATRKGRPPRCHLFIWDHCHRLPVPKISLATVRLLFWATIYHILSLAYKVTDASLASQLDAVTAGDSYTILFYATPREPLYESHFIEPVHMDMKRDMGSAPLRRQDNETEFNKLPLFEKYQFFTPGELHHKDNVDCQTR